MQLQLTLKSLGCCALTLEEGDSGQGNKFSLLNRTLEVLHALSSPTCPPIAAHKIPFALMIIRGTYGALKVEGLVRRALQGVMGFSGGSDSADSASTILTINKHSAAGGLSKHFCYFALFVWNRIATFLY